MNKNRTVFLVMLLGVAILGNILFFVLIREKKAQPHCLSLKGAYFEPAKITGFFSQIPYVDIQIGDKTTAAKIDLGHCGYISLPKDVINGVLEKSFIRETHYFGIRGKKYYTNVFELPKIKIGTITLFQPKVEEINPEFEIDATVLNANKHSTAAPLGRLGWALFYNLNFFMDCQNSLIAFCDSLETLKKQGYPVDAFVETPLLLDRNLVEFEAITKEGIIRCALDTGSTLNMLNKDVEVEFNNHMFLSPNNIDQHSILNPTNSDQMILNPEDVYDMPVFKIGKQNFGPMTFQKIKTPFDIDAIIGMEFLENTLIFIDFPNRKIYFYEK